MQTVVAPEILQLLGVGVADVDTHPDLDDTHRDHYLHPGRYLRWLPNPTLGFPRRGFVLRRRPSPRWPWVKRGDMAEAAVDNALREGAALWLRATGFSSEIAHRGARVSRPGQQLEGGTDAAPMQGPGLMVEFYDRSQLPRPDPASWVALRVRAKNHVTVSATAWASGRAAGQDTVLSEASATVGDLDPWDFTSPHGDRVLIVHGGLVDAVELHADGLAGLIAVSWLITELYALDGSSNSQQTGWEEVGRFLLPLDDVDDYAAPPSPDALAEERLAAAVPRARAPWADPAWPPTEADADELISELAERHLGERLEQMRALLADVLDKEVAEGRPQGTVLVDPSIHPGITANADGEVPLDVEGMDETASAAVPAVPLLLAASMEAPLAHLLGLATVDREPPEQVPYDYVVSAVYPTLWWLWLLAPQMPMILAGQSTILAQVGEESSGLPVVPPLPPEDLEAGAPFFRAVSVATLVLPGALAPVPPPEDTDAVVRLAPARSPVPAEALLQWTVPEQPAFHPAPVVGATVTRTDADGTVSLARTDPVHGHELAYLGGTGDHSLRDAELRAQGDTAWYVRSLDIWGRWSMGTKATADIDARMPPPPVSGVTATLRGAIDDDAGTVEEIVVAFDWGPGQAAMAPDLARFEIALAAGEVDDDDLAGIDGSQGGAEVAADGSAVTPVGTVSASDLDDGTMRVEVVLPDAPAAANGYRRETTAVVRAVDADSERSRPAAALAEIVDAAPPDPPEGLPGVQRTSWPDADGLGWWTCQWSAAAGDRVQVLRAPASRLLEAAGESRADLLAEGDLDAQATHLRALASEVYAEGDELGPGAEVGGPKHAHAFSPDHPGSYVYPGDDRHPIAVDGSSQDLTVVVAMPSGPTGTRAAWPTDPSAFTVVAARRLDPLVPPRLVARAVDGAGVQLEVEAPGAASRVRLWRASDPEQVDDLRRMRPLPPAALDDEGEATLTDGPLPDATWYAYRAVVESVDRRRSAPTQPVWVRTR